MHASVNVGCQCKSGPGKIHEVILVKIKRNRTKRKRKKKKRKKENGKSV